MTIWSLAEWALRSSTLILAACILMRALRVKAPSIVLAVWTAVLAGSLAIPLIPMMLPKLPVMLSRMAVPPARVQTQFDSAPVSESSLAAAPGSPIASPRTPRVSGFDTARALFVFYGVVAGALLMRLLLGWILAHRMLRAAMPTGQQTEGIEIRESGAVNSPVALGVVRPVIVLPNDWRAWDGAKLAAVLAHERSHIRRCDPAVQVLSSVHRALLWHSPLSWFLHRRIVRMAEEASDDAALATTSDRASYAEVLLEFMQRGVRRTSWQGVPMARYCEPEERIHRILDGSAIARGVTLWSAAAIVILGAPLTYLAAAAHPQRMTVQPLTAPSLALPAQDAPAGLPKFEVVSIKPCTLTPQKPGDVYPPRGNSSPGSLRTGCFPLLDEHGMGLIRGAYASDAFTPINGGPSWIHSASTRLTPGQKEIQAWR